MGRADSWLSSHFPNRDTHGGSYRFRVSNGYFQLTLSVCAALVLLEPSNFGQSLLRHSTLKA